MKKKTMTNIDRFIALPDEEKEQIWQEIDSKSHAQLLAESRPLNTEERRRFAKFKKGLGRPKTGEGSKAINITVEKALLRRADAYAQKLGISRAQLVAKGLELAMGSRA